MIQVRGLTKTYADGKEALRDLSLDVGEGMFGLLGPNGAGKTTFLSMLVLVCEPTAGSRVYFGRDAARAGDRAVIRGMMGYLPQDFAPVGQLTAIEYLIHCARLRGLRLSGREIERRALDLLDAVDLTHAARRRSGEFSGGMKRRLGIAQALIHRPRVLVVDEPTAGLDPEERIRFRNLIADVADTTAVLLSTHIVEDVEATCPRLGVIADGKLLFDGEISELLRRADGKLWDLPADAAAGAGAPIVSRRLAEGGRARVVVYSEQPVPGAEFREPSLEEAYSAFLALHGVSGGGGDEAA